MADRILDTSTLTVHELRDRIREMYTLEDAAGGLLVSVLSFGFKYGVPAEADLVFDVRFLPNPNFVPALKPLSGSHPRIVRYLRRQADTLGFLKHLSRLLAFLVPRYAREGKSYLTIAVGCTGGRHRSVMVADAVAAELIRRRYRVRVHHRDARLEGP
jgi:UPF0042 nucleotide-binding protein